MESSAAPSRRRGRHDDHFGDGDGSERRAWTKPWTEGHTEVGLPNSWDDRKAREPAGDSAGQGLADSGDATRSALQLLLMVWCQGRKKPRT